jgi:ATP-dependent RNA helicase RhlE
MDAVAAMGYETPSPVQAQAIPPMLQGHDLLGQARTGTGKTAAFGIPLVEKLRSVMNGGMAALILVPTRELALQVTEELVSIAKGSPLKVYPIYGGAGMGRQTDDLRRGGTQIVVATPGRLLDHMQQGNARLDKIKILILDEADRMLDMGFIRDMEKILRAVPPVRQTALFSATVPDDIRRLSQKFLKDPVTVRVEAGPQATPLAEQFKIFLEKSQKTRGLLALLAKEKPERAIVFTRTKHQAKRIARQLVGQGHPAVALQGNMSQNQRERAMEDFRQGKATLMVATDVASRGIDVPEMSHVVNYDIPTVPEDYVHRIGRTGRMGRTGRAFTFIQSDEHHDLKLIERTAGSAMAPFDIGELPAEPAVPAGMADRGDNHSRRPFHGRGGGGGGGGRSGGGGGSGHHAKKSPQGESRGYRGGGYGGRNRSGGGGRSSGGSGSSGGGSYGGRGGSGGGSNGPSANAGGQRW